MDLVPPPGQMLLGREKDALTGVDGAPDCRRSTRNRTIQFAKLNSPVCLVSSRSFWLLFVLCVNSPSSSHKKLCKSSSSISIAKSYVHLQHLYSQCHDEIHEMPMHIDANLSHELPPTSTFGPLPDLSSFGNSWEPSIVSQQASHDELINEDENTSDAGCITSYHGRR
jgi:hypothetical protein